MQGAIIVDIQGDFTQLMSGPLAVPGTNLDYLHKINKAVDLLKGLGIPVWASQDWHPEDHISFFSNHPGKKMFETISLPDGKPQILWPPHCVQGTAGADLLIDPDMFQGIIQKGRDPRYDSYSCFQDDGGQETELDGILKQQGIKDLIVFGIATDFCVRWTTLDGFNRGYRIQIIKPLCRGVNPETSARALEEIQSNGAVIIENLESWVDSKR
jgi:nicotinamidase/pyrazinamidase